MIPQLFVNFLVLQALSLFSSSYTTKTSIRQLVLVQSSSSIVGINCRNNGLMAFQCPLAAPSTFFETGPQLMLCQAVYSPFGILMRKLPLGIFQQNPYLQQNRFSTSIWVLQPFSYHTEHSYVLACISELREIYSFDVQVTNYFHSKYQRWFSKILYSKPRTQSILRFCVCWVPFRWDSPVFNTQTDFQYSPVVLTIVLPFIGFIFMHN